MSTTVGRSSSQSITIITIIMVTRRLDVLCRTCHSTRQTFCKIECIFTLNRSDEWTVWNVLGAYRNSLVHNMSPVQCHRVMNYLKAVCSRHFRRHTVNVYVHNILLYFYFITFIVAHENISRPLRYIKHSGSVYEGSLARTRQFHFLTFFRKRKKRFENRAFVIKPMLKII